VTRDELLELLSRLRCAPVGRARLRAPHKPLLLLWLFARFAAAGSTVATYAEAEEPVSVLINEFGPRVVSAAGARQRAAMPFVHLERELWDLRDGAGAEIRPDAPGRGAWLVSRGAVGRLRPDVEQLLADPGTLAAAARLLLDLHFTPGLRDDLRSGRLGPGGAGTCGQHGSRDCPAERAAGRVRRGGAARLRLPMRHVRIRRRAQT
jgi:putative restriction endonuclease